MFKQYRGNICLFWREKYWNAKLNWLYLDLRDYDCITYWYVFCFMLNNKISQTTDWSLFIGRTCFPFWSTPHTASWGVSLPSACLAGPAAGSWAAESACRPPRSWLAGSCPVPVWAGPPRSCRRPAGSAGSRSPPSRPLPEKHLQIQTTQKHTHTQWHIIRLTKNAICVVSVWMPNSIVLYAQEESVSVINKNTNIFLLFSWFCNQPNIRVNVANIHFSKPHILSSFCFHTWSFIRCHFVSVISWNVYCQHFNLVTGLLRLWLHILD